jgi:hypothetical protein
LSSSPTLVTPDLGTPSALIGTSITGTSNSFSAGFGVNQTWQIVARSLATNYVNTTGKTIYMKVTSATQNNVTASYTLTVSGVAFILSQASTQSIAQLNNGAPIPPGATYALTNTGTTSLAILQWTELR